MFYPKAFNALVEKEAAVEGWVGEGSYLNIAECAVPPEGLSQPSVQLPPQHLSSSRSSVNADVGHWGSMAVHALKPCRVSAGLLFCV